MPINFRTREVSTNFLNFLLLCLELHGSTDTSRIFSKNVKGLRGCLVYIFKQQFSVFKQHFTHFNALFHPHVFPQMFLNNNFQFLNTYTKQALNLPFSTIKLS